MHSLLAVLLVAVAAVPVHAGDSCSIDGSDVVSFAQESMRLQRAFGARQVKTQPAAQGGNASEVKLEVPSMGKLATAHHLNNLEKASLKEWFNGIDHLYKAILAATPKGANETAARLDGFMTQQLSKVVDFTAQQSGTPQKDILTRMHYLTIPWSNNDYHGIWDPSRPWIGKHKGPNRYSSKAGAKKLVGIERFFKSTTTQNWLIYAGVLVVCFIIQSRIYSLPSQTSYHAIGLLVWIGVAACFNVAIYCQSGQHKAMKWFSGWLTEFVFSIENVFVFHYVVRAFRVPRRHAQKALAIVVICQIVIEAVFYMGLAYYLRETVILPYGLGLWLLYLAYLCAFEGKHEDMEFEETWVYRRTTSWFGSRMYPKYERSCSLLFRGKNGLGVTLLFIATISLVFVDSVLEVDVTLTKILDTKDAYTAFTSSCLAAFAVPELFFVSRDIFARFYMLKYGIAFVLFSCGIQSLLHDYISIPTIWQCVIMLTALLCCVIGSEMFPGVSDLDADKEAEEDFPDPEYLWVQPPEERTETALSGILGFLGNA